MINVCIAHPHEANARKMANELLQHKLVARLSIDYDNHVFEVDENDVVREVSISLVTAQTKAILFQEILNFVHQNYGDDIPVYSLPITQGNEELTRIIREKTKKF